MCATVRIALTRDASRFWFNVMKYTVRPKNEQAFGSFSVMVADPREALDVARELIERGVKDVEILDEEGTPYDLNTLELQTSAIAERQAD